jgi:hypothetical protein
MPNCSTRVVDKRPKFPAYLVTYSSTSLTIDYCYRQLLGLRFPITEVIGKKRSDGGLDIHAFLGYTQGRSRRLSPAVATVGGERSIVINKEKKNYDTHIYTERICRCAWT